MHWTHTTDLKIHLHTNRKFRKNGLKGMSSTFPKVRKMCFPNFRKIFSENFLNFRKIFSFVPKVRKNIFRKFGKIKFRCSHLLSILVRFLSQSSLSKTDFYQFHSQFGIYFKHDSEVIQSVSKIDSHWFKISACALASQ